jgi:putative acetyltransferase
MVTRSACLVSSIRRLSRQIVRELGLLDDPHPQLGLDAREIHLLIEFDSHSALTVGKAAALLNVHKSIASRLIARLLKKGWACPGKAAVDGRCKPFILTRQGRQKAAETNRWCDGLMRLALERLDKDERLALEKSLALYADALAAVRRRSTALFRPLQKRDDKLLRALFQEVDAEFGVKRARRETTGMERLPLHRRFSGKGASYFVAEVAGEVVGGAGICPRPDGLPTDCELQKLYLSPEARGLGIGRGLLEHCLAAARKFGYRCCYAATSARFAAALRPYESRGFLPARRERAGCPAGCDRILVKQL